MVKIWSVVDGKTFGWEKKILKKLKKRGAKLVETPEDSDAIIVFCPIVSRFETDITSALSNVPGNKKVIVAAMHHTYDPNYTVPDNQERDGKLVVSFLFFEKKGVFSCRRNSDAKKKVYKELSLPRKPHKLPKLPKLKKGTKNQQDRR